MQDHLDKVACWEEGGRGCREQARSRSRSLISESGTLVISDEIQSWSLFTAQSFLQTAPD